MAREDIIALQRWVANVDPDSSHPLIKDLVTHLMRARSSIERIMIEQQQN